MANPTFTTAPRNGSPANGQANSGRTVDWNGYPALFQRVTPETHAPRPTNETVQSPTGPAPVIGRTGGVREAFLGFCQAALLAPFASRVFDRPSDTAAAARALAAAEAFGFTRDEIRELGCGLYSSPATLREDLRGVGFVDAEIDAARLVSDETGRPRAELAGSLLVPLTDESGHLCDFLLLSVAENGRGFSGYRFLAGPSQSKIVVYGLQTALSRSTGRESLVIVDDVLEGLFLQCRGLSQVAAIGASGRDLTPRRWEELARLGVATVTLAFRQDESHAADVRSALVNALRAKTAPQVYVADAWPGHERSAADVFRRFGKDACVAALAARSLAFHDKDFGAADRVRTVAEPVPPMRSERRPVEPPPRRVEPASLPSESLHRTAYRQHLAELVASMPVEDRSLAEPIIEQVAAAMTAGDLARASWLIHAAGSAAPRTWPTSFWNGATSPGWLAANAWGATFGSNWSCEPAWLRRPTDEPATLRPASISPAGAVLDRLTKPQSSVEIPDHMSGYAGRETPSAIEWAIDESPRGRLATLCERVVDACERRPDQSFIIACCEHSEQQIMLALATHLAARLSEGTGLTIEEVRTRFAHSEPSQGYRNKPWLADEAADRLRLWSSRLTLVTCPPTDAGRTAIDQAIEMVKNRSKIGGIFFDALPASGNPFDPAGTGWLDDVATRCGGQVFATASSPPVVVMPAAPAIPAWPLAIGAVPAWSAPALSFPEWSNFGWTNSASPIRWSLPRTDGGQAVLTTLHEWLRRESSAAAA